MRSLLAQVLLASTFLSELLGPGIGRGVSRDWTPLRQEHQAYPFNQNTVQEYERALSEARRERHREELLFELFYLRNGGGDREFE